MPNLEQQVVTGWLAELRPAGDAAWPPAIRPIEAAGRVPEHLVALGAALDQLDAADRARLRDALRDQSLLTQMRTVLAQFGAARTLRLLHWLAEVDLPDCHAVMAGLTRGQDESARALRATVEAVTRQAMIRRMFAPERITALELASASVKETII